MPFLQMFALSTKKSAEPNAATRVAQHDRQQDHKIQGVLTEVDTILRRRLSALGVEIGHVLLAISPEGAGTVRSNVGPADLGDMADLLAEIVVEAASRKPDNEPLN